MNKVLFQEENQIIFANGVFGIGYKLELPEKYSLGETDYLSLNEYWNKALKDLPTGSIFYKQDVFLEDKFKTNHFSNTNFIENEFVNHFNGIDYLNHTCYLFFLLPTNNIISDALINPFKKLNKKNFEEYDQRQEAFVISVLETVQFLNSVKLQGGNSLNINPLSYDEFNNYYDLYFNLFDDSQISDRFFNKTNLNIGDKFASVLCMLDESKMPDNLSTHKKDKNLSNDKTTFFKNNGDNFSFDLPFSHIYNQICIIDDNRKHLDDLRRRNDQLHKSSSFDKENEHFAKETDSIITDIIQDIDTIRLIRGHNNVIIIASTENQLGLNVLKAKETFKDLDIKAYVPAGNYLNAIFNNSFPFFTPYLSSTQLYLSSLNIFCSFLNNTGNYKTDSTGILYNSRLTNTPVLVDTWDEKKKYMNAKNFFIVAPTGYGKSFVANHIISSYYSQGVKTVIVDLGGSYKKLSALFPQDTAYITYVQGQSLGINPFKIESLDTDKLEELVEFVRIHYKRGDDISEMEKTSIRKMIEEFYKAIPAEHSLPTFVDFIKNSEELLKDLQIKSEFFDREQFLHLMSDFVGNGAYSFLYKKSENDLGEELKDKKIIVFELDQARENQLLLTVMLQLVSSTINKVIWRDKSTKGIVLFDEVAEQLQWDGVLRRIQFFYQAIRKQNGAIGIILQAVSQLPESTLSKSILENTQVLYVLHAKDYRALQSRFNLSEHAYYQLTSIQSNFNGLRPYSEIFIMRGNVHQVYRLEVPLKVYWAYQTEGAPNQKLLDIYNEMGDMESAIDKFLTIK